MATFNFSFTYPDDKVEEFARFMGWNGSLDVHTYIQNLASEHINHFTTAYAEHRKQEAMEQAKIDVERAYNDGIISEIKSALTSSIS